MPLPSTNKQLQQKYVWQTRNNFLKDLSLCRRDEEEREETVVVVEVVWGGGGVDLRRRENRCIGNAEGEKD